MFKYILNLMEKQAFGEREEEKIKKYCANRRLSIITALNYLFESVLFQVAV